jgi:DeoR family fructose operon transcriptional repressor
LTGLVPVDILSTCSVRIPQDGFGVLAAERHGHILGALRGARVVRTEDLAHQLDVSLETVRRDLVVMEQRGALRRVRGGATGQATFAGQEPTFEDRSSLASAGKQSIGRLAAAMVSPGQTVILDVGTTALEVARALPADFTGTVATCSLPVAAELASRRSVEVLVSGGRLRSGDLSLSNAQAVAFFADLHADIAFLGSGGLHPTAGLTDFHVDEIATRRVILRHSAQAWILADSSKFGVAAPHRVCGLDELHGLVTDCRPPAELASALERSGATVVAHSQRLRRPAPHQPRRNASRSGRR